MASTTTFPRSSSPTRSTTPVFRSLAIDPRRDHSFLRRRHKHKKKGATSSDSTTLIVIVVVLLILLLLLILVGLYVRHRYQEQLKSNMTQAIVTKRKGDDDDDEGSLSHVGQDIAGPSQISLHTTARRNQVTPSDAEDKPAWEDEKKIETLV